MYGRPRFGKNAGLGLVYRRCRSGIRQGWCFNVGMRLGIRFLKARGELRQ